MNDSLTFAHLSDPHLTSLSGARIGELLSKRILGYLTWRFTRRHEHLGEILDALTADLKRLRPDHVVVTGDLTHLGLPSEFREATRWLHALGSPRDVTVVPGNHDAYVKTRWEQTYSLWWPYMAGDPQPQPQPRFPSIRLRGPVMFIGLSTAHPSAPFFAVGSLGPAQLERLEAALLDGARRGLCRVVLIHHPPLPNAVGWRKHLTDSRALRDVLMRTGAELLLHGHTHYALRMELQTPAGAVPSIGVPSASAAGRKEGRRAQYNVYHIARAAGGWDVAVTTRGYDPHAAGFAEAARSRLHLERRSAGSRSPHAG